VIYDREAKIDKQKTMIKQISIRSALRDQKEVWIQLSSLMTLRMVSTV